MSDNLDDVVENLKQPSEWARILIMVGFTFVLYFVLVPAITVLMVAQALFTVITGSNNRNLRGLGSVVEQYVSQIIDFLSYNSDLRPFPFSEFPADDFSVDSEDIAEKTVEKTGAAPVNTDEEESAEAVKKPAKKKAAKKAPVKKKAAKKKAAPKAEPKDDSEESL